MRSIIYDLYYFDINCILIILVMITIELDIRERELIDKMPIYMKNLNLDFVIVTVPLEIGDIIVKQDDVILLIIERKTINDLLASLKDGRYSEQCLRLQMDERCGMCQKIYLIEGNVNAYNDQCKQTIYSTITTLTLFKGFQHMRTLTVEETCNYILMTANKIQKSLKNGKTFYNVNSTSNESTKSYTDVIKTCKKENVTPQNISQIMLMQIPGISAATAEHILDGFESIYDLIHQLRTNPKILENKTYTLNGKPRKINKKCLENVALYLTDICST